MRIPESVATTVHFMQRGRGVGGFLMPDITLMSFTKKCIAKTKMKTFEPDLFNLRP